MPDHTVSHLFADGYSDPGVSAVVRHLIEDQGPVGQRLPPAVNFLKIPVFLK